MYESEFELRETLALARQKIEEQHDLLDRLTQTPLIYAPVVSTGSVSVEVEFGIGDTIQMKDDGRTGVIEQIDTQDNGELFIGYDDPLTGPKWVAPEQVQPIQRMRDFVVVSFEGKLTEVEAYPGIKVKPGDIVKLSAETMQIVDVADINAVGELAVVRQVLDSTRVEIDYDSGTRIIFSGQCVNLEKGDKVILDPTASIAMRSLGKFDQRYTVSHNTQVSWENIGGLTEPKRQMIGAVEMPFRHASLYKFYGKKPVKGILLYGPPGCGKTMLGKAAATALAKLHGSDATDGFLYVKGPELLDRFVGVAESNIRQIFERARKHHEVHGYPAVIFIDEADAIMGRRGTGISSDFERTIVPTFLTEMDGLEESHALVILATNRPDILDPAIVRDGRIDRKVKVGRPDEASAIDIFKLYLRNVPLCQDSSIEDLAAAAASELFSADKALYTINLTDGMSINFPLSGVCSGGMIAGIVDQASSIALERDLSEGTRNGIRHVDLMRAVEEVYGQNLDLGHEEAVVEYTQDFHGDVTSIQRVKSLVN